MWGFPFLHDAALCVLQIEKQQKKQGKREKQEKAANELKRMVDVLLVQSTLDSLGSENVRQHFKTGKHGAVVCSISAVLSCFSGVRRNCILFSAVWVFCVHAHKEIGKKRLNKLSMLKGVLKYAGVAFRWKRVNWYIICCTVYFLKMMLHVMFQSVWQIYWKHPLSQIVALSFIFEAFTLEVLLIAFGTTSVKHSVQECLLYGFVHFQARFQGVHFISSTAYF